MSKTPCGHCDSGTYAVGAVLYGLAEFGHCKTAKEALRQAPMCKCERHICYGARDWISGAKFPMTDADRKELILSCLR